MKVLVHALGANMGGGVRHLRNFIPELARKDTVNEYRFLVRDSLGLPETRPNIAIEAVASAASPKRVYSDLVQLPLRLRRERFDAIVTLTNFGPVWSTVPHIVFQRNPIYYNPYYLSQPGRRDHLEIAARRFWAVESMKRARVIVTPTTAMAEMIREACPEVAHCAFRTLHHGFTQQTLNKPLDNRLNIDLEDSRFKLLYPTHLAAHKGFEMVWQALAALKQLRQDFVFYATISREDWPEGYDECLRRIDELHLKDHVRLLGRVPQDQMGQIYKKADLMFYASPCESFGFSMVEAMGCGLPIAAADTAVNREMCQDAAIYYPLMDPHAIAGTIDRLLTPAALSDLSRKGADRLRSFDWSWGRYAEEFISLVKSVQNN